MKSAAHCLYPVLLIALATVLGACQMVAPPALDEALASVTATPAAGASEPLETTSTTADTETDSPEPEPARLRTDLTFEALAGLWEHACIYTDVNADGTYTTWSGLPQPGGFPREAGDLELIGQSLTFHSGEDGLLCRNQSGTYEVIAWSSDKFELALEADECADRKGGSNGTHRRVAGADYDPEGGTQLAPCDEWAVDSP